MFYAKWSFKVTQGHLFRCCWYNWATLYIVHKLNYSRFSVENSKFSLPWQQRSVRAIPLVWECCKDDQESQWEMLNFDPATNHELKRSSLNLACLITSWIPSSKKKNGFIPLRGFVSPYTQNIDPHVRYADMCLGCMDFFTLNTSNDAVPRKEVPFEG